MALSILLRLHAGSLAGLGDSLLAGTGSSLKKPETFLCCGVRRYIVRAYKYV